IVLLPGSPFECFDFAGRAFDLAERMQQPVFVASDLDLGMNNWMADPFPYPERPLDRGKVLSAQDLDKAGEFARYKDVDGDAVPYRTLPGTDHPLAAYFTRGTGHDERAAYSERPEDYQDLMDRLARKPDTSKKLVPQPAIDEPQGAEIGLIAYGSSDVAIQECRDQLRLEHGIETAYLRIRALPLTHHVEEFASRCRTVYSVEQNRNGQMGDLLRLEAGAEAAKIINILHYSGLPIDARFVTDRILESEHGKRD
ncbi:MAG: 2-oxoacid:acceptor oxidoreductase subunit alpha, partial [Acidobacteriota bacterium]